MPKLYRKILRIRGDQSPNVRLALAEIAAGKEPSNRILVPGVLSYEEYCKRLATWDKVRQTIGIFAEFYEGTEVLMFPPDWLNASAAAANALRSQRRKALAIGVDPGEGVSDTAMVAIDDRGIIELVSRPTPNTSVIVGEIIAFINKHHVPCERVCIDRGGGGKEHADILREKGYPIRTVAFGASVVTEPKRTDALPPSGARAYEVRKENVEERYTYVKRRGQMYGEMRQLLDPSNPNPNREGIGIFAIPAEYVVLRQEMAPIPLQYDGEGRMLLPSKNRKPGQKDTTTPTLTELCGHSPDQLDSLVLAVHAMLHKEERPRVGPIWK